jgi:hypothetical protein
MSTKSKDLRDRAARELRESRNGGSAKSKADNVKRGAAYKALSKNEEWLDGETKKARSLHDQTSPGRFVPK